MTSPINNNKRLKGKEFWNAISKEYAADKTKSRKYIVDPVLFETIGEIKGKKILDVACGTGDLSIQLSQHGGICTGIDFADDLVEIAKSKSNQLSLQIDYHVMNVREIQGLSNDYDIAVVALLFPHLPSKQDIGSTLKSIVSVLKPNGRLIIAEPHPSFDYYMRTRLGNGNYRYFESGLVYDFTMDIGSRSLQSQAYHWTLQDYSDMLAESGFAIRRIIEPQPTAESKKLEPTWYQEKVKYPPYIILDCFKQT